ncbi:Sm protein F [Cryptosporidium ryanae]|uniref:Sm protein F n=1 Tax=Cryptosporidium ryanae TaxID=515981 RepID=UPI00351A1DF6|nr:Sm protein F [Cryptosporidium ryanae]
MTEVQELNSEMNNKNVTKAVKKSPSDFLRKVIGNQVIVRLNSGVDYKGLLACLDDRMNIAMENTEEYVNGSFVVNLGDTFIRGNNVLYISALNN